MWKVLQTTQLISILCYVAAYMSSCDHFYICYRATVTHLSFCNHFIWSSFVIQRTQWTIERSWWLFKDKTRKKKRFCCFPSRFCCSTSWGGWCAQSWMILNCLNIIVLIIGEFWDQEFWKSRKMVVKLYCCCRLGWGCRWGLCLWRGNY